MVDMRPQVGKDRYIWGQKLLDWIETVIAPEGGLDTSLFAGYVNTILNAGTNISLSYDDLAGQITITNLITTEVIRDTVNALVAAGDGITVAYDDMANTLTISGDFTAIETEITALETRTGTVLNTDGSFVDAAVMASVVAEGGPTAAEWSDVQTDLAGRARKGRVEAEDYGTLSTSSGAASTNTATLQAAATAAGALRADVLIPGFDIPINDQVVFPETVGLVGAGRRYSRLLATHADAELVFDSPSFATISGFEFDGEGIATQGIAIIGATHKLGLRDVLVSAVAGRPFRMHNVQNSILDGLDVTGSIYGLEVLDGCGSCVFSALSSNGNEYFLLKIGNTGEVVTGYTEPTANIFLAPMLEFYAAATANTIAGVVVTGSSRTMVINGNFAHGLADPMVKMTLEGSSVSSELTLFDSSFLGDPAESIGVDMANNTTLRLVGRNVITGADLGMVINGSNTRIDGEPVFNNVGTEWTFSGGASPATQRTHYTDVPQFYEGIESNADMVRLRQPGDTAARLNIKSNGGLAWGDGSGAEDATLYRSAAGMIHSDHMISAFGGLRSGDGAWNGGHLRLEPYHIWVDSTGDLRIKSGAPGSDTDGTVVGTQS